LIFTGIELHEVIFKRQFFFRHILDFVSCQQCRHSVDVFIVHLDFYTVLIMVYFRKIKPPMFSRDTLAFSFGGELYLENLIFGVNQMNKTMKEAAKSKSNSDVIDEIF